MHSLSFLSKVYSPSKLEGVLRSSGACVFLGEMSNDPIPLYHKDFIGLIGLIGLIGPISPILLTTRGMDTKKGRISATLLLS